MKIAIEKTTTGLDHFKATVPDPLAYKMKELAELVQSDYISDYNHNAYGCSNLNEISGVGYSGFIPFQDGGFEVTELYSDYGSGTYLTPMHSAWVDQQQEDCFKAFVRDSNLPENTTYEDLTEEQQNELGDYENEWFEGALLRFEVWCNADSEAHWDNAPRTVYMRLAACYRDAPYYRSKHDETIKELTFSIEDFIKADIETLAKQLFN